MYIYMEYIFTYNGINISLNCNNITKICEKNFDQNQVKENLLKSHPVALITILYTVYNWKLWCGDK